TRRRVPWLVAMPAASWPRCWSTVRPSYRRAATSVVPTMPTMPHMGGSSGSGWGDGSGVRPDEAVDAEARLHAGLQLLGLGAGGDRTGLHPGQAAAVGLHAFGEGPDAGRAQAVAQRIGLRRVAEGAQLHREAGAAGGRRGRRRGAGG